MTTSADDDDRARKLSEAIAASKRAEREEHEADIDRVQAADERVVEALAERPGSPDGDPAERSAGSRRNDAAEPARAICAGRGGDAARPLTGSARIQICRECRSFWRDREEP